MNWLQFASGFIAGATLFNTIWWLVVIHLARRGVCHE